jgi:hypothetical protein
VAQERPVVQAPLVRDDLEGFGPGTDPEFGTANDWIEAPSGGAMAASPGESPGELPSSYGVDRCRVMVRDPYCIHAYWEILPQTWDRARADLAEQWDGHRRILRVHGHPTGSEPNEPGEDTFDLPFEEGTNNWYIQVKSPNRAYHVDVGVITHWGLFLPLASSNTVTTPRNGVSAVQANQWATPEEIRQAAEQVAEQVAEQDESSSVVGSAATAASGPVDAGGVSTIAASGVAESGFPGGADWDAPTSSAALIAPALFESGQGLIPGGPGIPPGVPQAPPKAAERPPQFLSGMGGEQFPTPAHVSPVEEATEARGPASQDAVPRQIPLPSQERGFWFVLNTELIVYGATDPMARVTLQGVPVPLRPDGTFSLRFQLPDGVQELRAEATSFDGHARRTITPTVTRSTSREQFEEDAAGPGEGEIA